MFSANLVALHVVDNGLKLMLQTVGIDLGHHLSMVSLPIFVCNVTGHPQQCSTELIELYCQEPIGDVMVGKVGNLVDEGAWFGIQAQVIWCHPEYLEQKYQVVPIFGTDIGERLTLLRV